MRASMGGIVSIFLLAIFVLILSSFLLFNVNYSKAFRVKNKVITAVEQFEGDCEAGSQCYNEIKAYEEKLGYGKKNITPQENEVCNTDLGYCYSEECETKTDDNYKHKVCVYEIRTEVDMDFPLVEQIMGILKFKIHGKTKAIVKTEKI